VPPRSPIILADEAWGCDLEAEVAVITTDVPQGISPKAACDHIALVCLVNDVSLRNLIPDELAKGFGFFQSKPASSFSPVAVTPESLGPLWDGGRLHVTLNVDLDNQPLGRAETGVDMIFDFGSLIAHAARTRNLCAGTIIGSGTVSNRDRGGGPGKPIRDGGLGYSCLAEVRVVETILHGAPTTPFLRQGQSVRIWANDQKGHSIFGAIEQKIQPPNA
jgi:fumarylacetoacetate (FAA) hydrolase